MASTKEIKRRITSIKNTKKITKAMELVAAAKMKKAVGQTVASRVYAGYSWEVLTSLSQYVDESTHELLKERNGNRKLIVLVTSNRGLCGSYNAQIMRKVIAEIKKTPTHKIDNFETKDGSKTIHTQPILDFITVGKKGDAMLRRLGKKIEATFTDISETPRLADTLPIARLVTDLYASGSYDEIHVAFTDYVSGLTQIPKIRKLLPVSKEEVKKGIEEAMSTITEKPKEMKVNADYVFEPSYEEVMKDMVVKIVRMQMYQMILESSASEQSARMIAMKNASDAAGDMIGDLTLVFNKARQAGITQEISEISAGMASVS
jgi:F-type H+-transporting ATPase subunit gamma